ncbi:hypothetical protein NW768_011148 [Fusarium equiseti]|uniref:NACHT domain-containing protein n=1 Tax=Fusarium equiseti TaxID=61235 RepID=A0ABQ8QZ50_FUSEQ|nr:hypothetical protein NW768_011148 [Fusarium equiseti]
MASSLPGTSASTGGPQTRTDSDLVFDKAVAKFKSRLNRTQAEQFAKCTIDDVRNQIRQIQDHHGSQRRLRNMNRLSKFVEGMVQLGNVVEVYLNLHNGVALIWGPIKFLLLIASNLVDSLDSLLGVYGQIGEVLPDLTRYGEIYKEYPYVHTHLESYYCDILEFHSNALDVFARPAWKVLFHSAWKTFKTQFDPILKSLENHRIMLSEERLTAVMEETQKQGHSIQDKLDELHRQLQERDQKNAKTDLIAHQIQIDQQRRIVEGKIDAPNYHEDYEIALHKRFQDTSGRWILSHPVVSEWLDHSSKANGKIYLSGIPGAGKTVLTSSIISHLQERRSSSKGSADSFSVSYFYFKHHQRKKGSLLSLLLALLAQLVAQDESLLDHVYQACRSAEPQQFRSLDEVSRLVSMALRSLSRCFVIIDGLDECTEASRVLEWFENIMSKRDDASRDTDFNIRLFISGQRDGILESQMSHYTRIDLETSSGHDQDIEAFTAAMAIKIRDRFSLEPGVDEDIASRVRSKAGGMFLYAQLVLNNLLSQTSKYHLKQELKAETFPEGLEQARYERVVVRVLKAPNKAERAAAKDILGMIMTACRPLHWREIQSKFCIDPTEGEADIDRKLVISCKHICSSLVDVSYLDPSVSSEGEEIIDLVHTTAGIYLVQTKEIDLQTENAKMALFCAEYMISRPLTSGLPKSEVQDYASKGYYGFHDYAVAFWWKHVQQVLAASELDNELARKVLQTADRYVTDIGEVEQIEAFDDSPQEIQYLKKRLEGIPQDLRDWDSMRIYEMRAVAVRDAVEVLINQPHEPKEAALALYGPWRYKCRKPWCHFFSSGFEETQQQQIHINQHELPFTCEYEGCHATEVGFGTETDLKAHARRWHPKEESSLFPAPKSHTPSHNDIMKAVRTGDLNKVKSLIEQINISPDYQKRGGKSLLELAVQNGHLHIVRYLTDRGAFANIKARQARSLLRVAVGRRDLEIVTFLCNSNRISFNEDTRVYNTLVLCVRLDPFPQAIMAQLLRIASLKSAQGVLLLAISMKYATAVAYFAEALDASCFNNALDVAAATAHLPCLDILLSSGKTDPNACDLEGTLPLHTACVSGVLPIVQRLYALTTTTNIENASGNTPLHLASMGGYVAVVEFLIGKGADINATNKDLLTPLQLAIRNGKTEVRKLLLDSGARLDEIDEAIAALPDANRMVRRGNSFGPLFDGSGMELANPLNSGDVLNDFDLDSFLHDQDGDNSAFNFTEAFPTGDEIRAD